MKVSYFAKGICFTEPLYMPVALPFVSMYHMNLHSVILKVFFCDFVVFVTFFIIKCFILDCSMSV